MGDQPLVRQPKQQYAGRQGDFRGHSAHAALMKRIKTQIKKDRIRLLEFFQDHDLLRKGYVAQQKFRSTLYSQKLFLTEQEYELLQSEYATKADPLMVDYLRFNEEIENIFTDKMLEKNPEKTVRQFEAASILDPKDVLDA